MNIATIDFDDTAIGDINSEINNEEEDLNEKIGRFYETFKKALLFYNEKQVDLPIYSLVNSYFIQDVLMISMIEILMNKPEINFDNRIFERILENRKDDYEIEATNTSATTQIADSGSPSDTPSGGKPNDASTPTQIISNHFDIERVPDSESSWETQYDKIQQSISDITEEMKSKLGGQSDSMKKIEQINKNTKNFLKTKYNKTFKKDIKSYYDSIKEASRNKQKYEAKYVNMLRDLYVNVFSFLRKQYNLHKIYTLTPTTESPSSKSEDSVSKEGTMLANNFLKTLTKGILTKSKKKYNSFKDEDSDMRENGELYRTERNLLIKKEVVTRIMGCVDL